MLCHIRLPLRLVATLPVFPLMYIPLPSVGISLPFRLV
jgi:hypothetical protein